MDLEAKLVIVSLLALLLFILLGLACGVLLYFSGYV
jgi:hypothetical protein